MDIHVITNDPGDLLIFGDPKGTFPGISIPDVDLVFEGENATLSLYSGITYHEIVSEKDLEKLSFFENLISGRCGCAVRSYKVYNKLKNQRGDKGILTLKIETNDFYALRMTYSLNNELIGPCILMEPVQGLK